jgi:hypothetical protein
MDPSDIRRSLELASADERDEDQVAVDLPGR